MATFLRKSWRDIHKMTKKKILICGATGFIGRNIVDHFSQRDDFELYGTYLNSKPYNNPKIKLTRADLRKEKDVVRVVEGIDVVIQMTATTSGARDILNIPYIHVT